MTLRDRTNMEIGSPSDIGPVHDRVAVLNGPTSLRGAVFANVMVAVCCVLAVAAAGLAVLIVAQWIDNARRFRSASGKVAKVAKVERGPREARPLVNPALWIGADDYPPAAIRAEQQGAVKIAWTIGIDGRVHDCHVVDSSGVASLDAVPCRVLTRRARYKPAIDASGRPVPTATITRRVVWRLPTQ